MEKRYNLNQRSLDKLKDVIRRVDGGKVSRRPTPTRRAPRMGGVGTLLNGTTTEFIDAHGGTFALGGSGDVILTLAVPTDEQHITATNATGRPIWKGSYVTMIRGGGVYYIVATNTAPLLYGEYVSGTATDFDSWTYTEAGGVAVDTSDVVNADFELNDAQGLLGSLTAGDVVAFSTGHRPGSGQNNALFAIGGGEGGGTGVWTGWPGPDPTTGVAPGIVFLATVNEATHVISSDTTFDFDGTTAIFGTAPASGTCNNTFAKAFIDGETFLCFGDNAGVYDAVKLGVNIARCQTAELVDHTSGDAEFDADTFVSIFGAVPSGTATIANDFKSQFPDNYSPLFVALQDNGKWRLLHDKTAALAKVTTGITARSGSGAPYTWGSGVMTILTKTASNTHSTTNGETGVTVYNSTLHTAAVDDVIQVKKIDGAWFWDVADCGGS